MPGTTHQHLIARDLIARADDLALAQRLETLAHDLSDAATPRDLAAAAQQALHAADAACAIDPDADAALPERVAAIAALSGVGAALLFGAAPPVRRNLADALTALAARLRGAGDGAGAPHGGADARAAANAAIHAAAASRAADVAAAAILVAAAVNRAARR